MIETSLCYIEKDDAYLMMHRVKKKNDLNHDKWVGVGGKFQGSETPEECVLRETMEETGLKLTKFDYRAVITFISDEWEDEHMHLFTATEYEGEIGECDEGTLEWVKKEDVCKLPIWEGDKLFFDLLGKCHFFTMKLVYEGERLADHEEKIYW